jgi:hypothetical protein
MLLGARKAGIGIELDDSAVAVEPLRRDSERVRFVRRPPHDLFSVDEQPRAVGLRPDGQLGEVSRRLLLHASSVNMRFGVVYRDDEPDGIELVDKPVSSQALRRESQCFLAVDRVAQESTAIENRPAPVGLSADGTVALAQNGHAPCLSARL